MDSRLRLIKTHAAWRVGSGWLVSHLAHVGHVFQYAEIAHNTDFTGSCPAGSSWLNINTLNPTLTTLRRATLYVWLSQGLGPPLGQGRPNAFTELPEATSGCLWAWDHPWARDSQMLSMRYLGHPNDHTWVRGHHKLTFSLPSPLDPIRRVDGGI